MPAGSVAAAVVETRAMQGRARRASERSENIARILGWNAGIKAKNRLPAGLFDRRQLCNGALGRRLVPRRRAPPPGANTLHFTCSILARFVRGPSLESNRGAFHT